MKSEKISAKELFSAIDQLYEEKGITREYLIESLKLALEAAYRKNYETNENIVVDFFIKKHRICVQHHKNSCLYSSRIHHERQRARRGREVHLL